MDGDIFINTKKNIIDKGSESEGKNFFLNQTPVFIKDSLVSDAARHLNDYDANILKDEAYQDINDDVFKLEYKISKLENELTEIDSRIEASKAINDYALADSLYSRKFKVQEELKELSEAYLGTSLSAKISGGITYRFKNVFSGLNESVSSFWDKLVSKLPGKLLSIIEVKSSLAKLADINRSVDELMGNKYPAWEAKEKYERLSKYIVKANSIQSEISRFLEPKM